MAYLEKMKNFQQSDFRKFSKFRPSPEWKEVGVNFEEIFFEKIVFNIVFIFSLQFFSFSVFQISNVEFSFVDFF